MWMCRINDFIKLQEFNCCLSFSFSCSVWEREENLHLATTNKLIHGGPRVHDGKYRHWSHVLLWGGYVQSCTPDLVLESRTPADPVDHPCSTLGRLRSLSLLCRTLQWSRRITLINSIHPSQWRPIISFVEILASRQHDHSSERTIELASILEARSFEM